jgi:CheY-like chemotaxis protein
MKDKLPILIVEDQLEEQDRISMSLSFLKIDNPLIFAVNRKTTFAYLDSLPETILRSKRLPGLIILDYYLQGEAAFNILKDIKSHPVYRQIPVIVFSTSNSVTDLNACYAHGCNGYFQKPDSEEGYHKILEIVYNFWFKEVELPYAEQRNRRNYYKTFEG